MHEPPTLAKRSPGPRRAALVQRRRRRRKRASAVAAALGAVAAVGVTAALVVKVAVPMATDDRPSAEPVAVADAVTTTLLVGTNDEAGSEAAWLTLLSVDAETNKAAVVYVPAHAAAEIPGRGLQPLGSALATGGSPLLVMSAEALLGVEIDHYLQLSRTQAQALFAQTGPLEVDVPADVRVAEGRATARLVLTAGPQSLAADRLVPLLYVRGMDGDDAELGSRHIAFWDALFVRFAGAPSALGQAVRAASGELGDDAAAVAEVGSFLATLAAVDDTGRTLAALPAHQVGVGGSELYRTDVDEVTAFLTEALGRPPAGPDVSWIQILNGNGVPGIGERIARRLAGDGFRVVLSGNARRFDYPRTLIVTYDGSSVGQETAQRARDLLGAGNVQISSQSQGIVDLTIVVGEDLAGKDFAKTR